jgi:hypothetical protein
MALEAPIRVRNGVLHGARADPHSSCQRARAPPIRASSSAHPSTSIDAWSWTSPVHLSQPEKRILGIAAWSAGSSGGAGNHPGSKSTKRVACGGRCAGKQYELSSDLTQRCKGARRPQRGRGGAGGTGDQRDAQQGGKARLGRLAHRPEPWFASRPTATQPWGCLARSSMTGKCAA